MRTFTYALKNGANLANHQGKSWMKTAEKKNCCASDKQAGEITVTFQCPVQFFFSLRGHIAFKKTKKWRWSESRRFEARISRSRTWEDDRRRNQERPLQSLGFRACLCEAQTYQSSSPELLRWQNNNKQTEIDCLQGRSALGGVAVCLDGGGGGGEEADKGAT